MGDAALLRQPGELTADHVWQRFQLSSFYLKCADRG